MVWTITIALRERPVRVEARRGAAGGAERAGGEVDVEVNCFFAR